MKRAGSRTLSILVVEDDPTLAELLRRVCNDVPGWGATVVHDAYAALETLRHVHAGVLVVDVNLPGMSGPELVSVLAGDRRRPALPVVMMSANQKTPEVEAAMQRGQVAHFIAKPFDLDEVLEAIHKAAASHPAQERIAHAAGRHPPARVAYHAA